MNFKTIFISSFILLCLDYLYITFNINYFSLLYKSIQNSPLKVKYDGAFLCYCLLIIAVNYFILEDSKKNLKDSFILGLCIYGIYELTNYATFKKWPIYMVVLDSIWGGILFSLTVYLTRKIKSYYKI